MTGGDSCDLKLLVIVGQLILDFCFMPLLEGASSVASD
jgi:hypothetical protein